MMFVNARLCLFLRMPVDRGFSNIEDNDVVRILLLTQDKRIPMMWKVLDNKFSNINFGVHRDKEGFQAIMLGVPEGSKVIVYGPGSNDPTVYKGNEDQSPNQMNHSCYMCSR